MCLLAAEIRAVTGKSPIEYYNDLCENWAGLIPCAAMRRQRWKKKINQRPYGRRRHGKDFVRQPDYGGPLQVSLR